MDTPLTVVAVSHAGYALEYYLVLSHTRGFGSFSTHGKMASLIKGQTRSWSTKRIACFLRPEHMKHGHLSPV